MKEKIELLKQELISKVNGINDLTAGQEPTELFYFLIDKFGYLLAPIAAFIFLLLSTK